MCTHTHTYTCANTPIHMHMHTHDCACRHTCTQSYTHVHTQTHACILRFMHTLRLMHTHAHTCSSQCAWKTGHVPRSPGRWGPTRPISVSERPLCDRRALTLHNALLSTGLQRRKGVISQRFPQRRVLLETHVSQTDLQRRLCPQGDSAWAWRRPAGWNTGTHAILPGMSQSPAGL